MTIKNDQEKKMKEENPFYREIWAAGYDWLQVDHISQSILLMRNEDKFTKRIPMFKLIDEPYKIISGMRPDGSIHRWLSEADGSCERFRRLICADGEIRFNN